ncbi:MAG: hypothetical protein NTW33_03650 [Methanoregula sp.]|nr:hypothetical protein [Methanoregula sp.]
MTRGRPVTKALDEALLIAKTRGDVMKFCPDTESACDMMIRTSVHLVFVRIKRVCKIRCTKEEIGAELQEWIILLRSFPVSESILCELWVYTKQNSWRYFRVGSSGLEEIGRDGNPVRQPEKGPAITGRDVTEGEAGTTPA